MAEELEIVRRVRAIMARGGQDFVEKKMFGGVCFMVRGHMCCGTAKGQLMLRVGKDAYADVLDRTHARPMTFTGRPLEGFVYVDAAGYRTDAALTTWVGLATAFVATLPRRVATRPSRTTAAKPPARAKAARSIAAKRSSRAKPAPITTASRRRRG